MVSVFQGMVCLTVPPLSYTQLPQENPTCMKCLTICKEGKGIVLIPTQTALDLPKGKLIQLDHLESREREILRLT